MPQAIEYKQVEEGDVPEIEGGVAVGEDLEFQRRWWRFEKAIWSVFGLILIADLSGLLGRGPLANAKAQAPDGTLNLKYERVLRENTASIMTILPEAGAVRDGKVQLFVSDSILKQFGASRVIPQPEVSTVGGGGVTYTFPATTLPMTVQIELKPSFIGMHDFRVGVEGGQPIVAKSIVLP